MQLARYFVGQVVGRLNKVQTCRQMVLNMVTEYAEAVERVAARAGEE